MGQVWNLIVEVEKSICCWFSTLSLKSKGSAISCWGSSSLHVFPDVSGHLSLSCSVQSVDLSLFFFSPPLCSFLLLADWGFYRWHLSGLAFLPKWSSHLVFAAACGLCQPHALVFGVLSLLTPGCLWNGWGTFPWETQCILKWHMDKSHWEWHWPLGAGLKEILEKSSELRTEGGI